MNENFLLIHKLLSSISDANSENRKMAEQELGLLKKKKKKDYFLNLLEILNNQDINLQLRRLAGLIMKNEIEEINSNETFIDEKWEVFLTEVLRKQVKEILLNILFSPSKVIRRTVSQVLSKFAYIELKNGFWQNIFEEFRGYISNDNQEHYFYEGILETIEFLFQEFFYKEKIFDIFQSKTDLILEIIFISIKVESNKRTNLNLTSLKALFTIIHFIEFNEFQCDVIFSLVIDQLTDQSDVVRKLAFEILEIMVKRYYRKIGKFISVIFDLTLITLEQDTEEVSLKAIEFWSTLADEEFQINVESVQALSEGRIAKSYSEKFIIKSATIFPFILLNFIENKPINYYEDWNCKSAVGLCLNLMSQAGPNEILPKVISFIENKIHIYSETKAKQTAVFSLIAIFDGIGAKVLYNHFVKTSYLWLSFSENDIDELQKTTFFLFGKIFQISPFVLRMNLDQIIQILLKNIVEKGNKTDIFWILNEIFQSFEPEGLLEWYLETICSVIFNLITHGISEGKVADELFEIICSIILNSSIRSRSRLFLLIPSTFMALKSSFVSNKPGLKGNIVKIQSHLFRFLGSCIQRFGQNFTQPFIDNITEFIGFLMKIQKKITLDSNLEDEIIIFIGTAIQKFKKECKALLNNLMPLLFQYVNKNIEHQTVEVAIGVLGDISCSYSDLDYSYLKKTTYILIDLLQNNDIGYDSKPLILSCLGDISLITENYFSEFQNLIIPIVKSTINSVNNYDKYDDYDLFEWVLALKESLLEILTGLIQGNSTSSSSIKLFEEDTEFFWLIKSIYDIISIDRIKRTTKLCIGLIGDCGASYRTKKKKLANFTWIKQLVFESMSNSYLNLSFMGTWASDSIYEI